MFSDNEHRDIMNSGSFSSKDIFLIFVLCLTKIRNIMKCNYCENEATRKDYREENGVTGKKFVCDICSGLSDVSLLDREAEVNKAKEEIFIIDENQAENFLETGWGDMWDTINGEMFEYKSYMINEFESETGQEPHEDTLDKWDEDMLEKIDKLIKKSI